MVSEEEREVRLFNELLGDSRDRPIGRLLDERAHRLIDAMYDGDATKIRELCSEDVTMITGDTGKVVVHMGVKEVTRFCNDDKLGAPRTIITIVDRRRITCPVEIYHYRDSNSFIQQRMVMIFDVDDACKVKRIEIRPVGDIGHKTGDAWAVADSIGEMKAENGR
ncbi:hypothetical protein LZ31DRAFT_537806 [Colletotrichum somersetense]|nr:hypothetical protein LZ31DRAFT_537806 [Colletotrichum somersetense]